MSYLRERGVQGFVVLNVLCFDEELQRLEERVRQVAQAGVDAVIVQVSCELRGEAAVGACKAVAFESYALAAVGAL